MRDRIQGIILGPRDATHIGQEKLEELQDIRRKWNQSETQDAMNAADAIIAALPSMVQPLEWSLGWADTAVGMYYIESGTNHQDTGSEWVAWSFNDDFDIYHHGTPAASVEAAEAAVLADMQRRIMAAFGIEVSHE